MATDGLSLYATICELQMLLDARIDKVQQPDKDLLLLHLHGPKCGRERLMINIHNENGRIQLTKQSFENPETATAFCMLLRKHLIGCRIAAVEQISMDRIASFSLYGKNELQDEVRLTMIVELMGKHGNLFLVDNENHILDCMRHFGLNEDSVRICLPGCIYEAPPRQNKLHPFNVSEEELYKLSQNRPPCLWLGNAVLGISKLCSQQICADDMPPDQIAHRCFAVLQDVKNRKFSPSVIPDRGVLPFVPSNAESILFPSMCEAQEAFYSLRDENAIVTKKRTALRAVIDHAYKRTSKKLETCLMQISNNDAMEQDRRYGELLIANMGLMKATPSNAIVTDYYADPPVEVSIPLDARYSIQQNAQRYFKQYRKAKTAQTYALSQKDSLSAEQEYLEGLQLAVEQCVSADELSELKDELTAQGYRKTDDKKRTKPASRKSEPYCYIAPDGTLIRVGKNNKQNEVLLKSESPNFTWLHAKGIAASHVYIESDNPSKETLALAAEIAAYHSRAAASAHVPVDYTLHRYVKKPAGARPGFVNYFHQHTIYITPQAEKLLRLRKE